MESPTNPPRLLLGPIALGAIVAAVVVAGSLWVRARFLAAAQHANDNAAAQFLSIGPHLTFNGPPEPELFDRTLRKHIDSGLRYMAMVGLRSAHVIREAGSRVGSGELLAAEQSSDWSRATLHFPPPPGRPDLPGVAFVVEYVPIAAVELTRQASYVLPTAVGFALVLVALGFVISLVLLGRQKTEFAMQQQKQLVVLGEMSAILAHEIKNPLASLKGHAQLLEEMLPTGGRESKKANRVVNDALRLQELVESLLEFVRTGALRITSVNPNTLLQSCIDEVGGGITVEANCERLIGMDERRIHQVLTNVLRNAVQASLSAKPPHVSVQWVDHCVEFRIRDFGSGFGKTPAEQVFDAFYSTKSGGVGLGLAIAKRIVDRHNGSLTASNHPNGGAEFVVRLPHQEK